MRKEMKFQAEKSKASSISRKAATAQSKSETTRYYLFFAACVFAGK
jgi:hypothetical protein